MSATAQPRKPGRPRGSITLTDERRDQIITMLRGGASLKSAAETAGVPIRTLQGWIKSGSATDPRPTRKLRTFAEEVKRARAEATMSAEVRVHKDQPATWLRHAVRPSELDDGGDDDAPDVEQIKTLAKRFRDMLLLTDASEIVPRCANRGCRCMFHRERTPDELHALLAITGKGATP